jgi:hypothetical protein
MEMIGKTRKEAATEVSAAQANYGISASDIRSIAANLLVRARAAMKSGRARSFNGNLDSAICVSSN